MKLRRIQNIQQVEETSVSSNPTPSQCQRRGYYLKNAYDVRRMLSGLTNQVLSGDLTPERYKTICYGTNVILRAIELTLMEERVSSLERKLGIVKE